MTLHQRLAIVLALIMAMGGSLASTARAVTIAVDYTYDSGNFFTPGSQARAAMDAAAGFFTNLLDDTLSPIVTPETFVGDFGGTVSWSWTMSFTNPTLGTNVTLTNPTVLADEYRIYAGARSLGGSTAGQGGPGGWGWSSTPSGGFTADEIDQIDAITNAFEAQVEQREETTGFANWGGALTFDNDGSTTWHFDHTTSPSGSQTDFFSVALHELGHALGLGASPEWNALISGGQFIGAESVAANGNQNVPLADTGHWAEGTMSQIYPNGLLQEAAMDPNILDGTRKLFTNLDVAALTDIGWTVAIPEPGTVVLLSTACLLVLRRRHAV